MELNEQVAQAAQERGIRIAAAESLTSGAVCSALGAASGAQEWFAGGLVAYGTDVKQRLLGLAEGVDPCSSECANTLAAGVRELLQADLAVSTTGVGGPDPQDGHDPGTVYIAWASDTSSGCERFDFDGSDPAAVVEATTQEALRMLQSALSDEARTA